MKLLLSVPLVVMTIVLLHILGMATVELMLLIVVLSVISLLVSSILPVQLVRNERLGSWLERLGIRSESTATPIFLYVHILGLMSNIVILCC